MVVATFQAAGSRLLAVSLIAAVATSAVLGTAMAQSTNQQIQQMEKQLDMNATPDLGALGFQDDLAQLEQCQSACKPLIDSMLKKYKAGAAYGGNGKLGTSDVNQLAVAIGSAAATLTKEQAAEIGTTIQSQFGADAETAYQGSYSSTTAPYAPK